MKKPPDDKKLRRKTVGIHQKDNMKHGDGMTLSSHTRETAGGGHGIFSNADGDVRMSILQKRYTACTDNVKYDYKMTTSSRARDTVGGGRGAFSNAYNDVPMSILQQRHTSNAHHNDDNSHHQHDHKHDNTEKYNKAATAKRKERGKSL